jgi:N-acetylmuramoyl-L-alanine amidase
VTDLTIVRGLMKGVPFIPSAATSGPFKQPPTLLIMHYTASGSESLVDASYFAKQKRDGDSAHLVIGRDGKIVQCESFLNVAHHAGLSTWRGRSFCNSFSIGVELDNWGILTKRADGKFYSWTGAMLPTDRVEIARHKNMNIELPWEIYDPIQVGVLDDVTRAILAAYPSIKEVVGHEDVAPTRKQDPGPSFPMSRYQSLFSPNFTASYPTAMVRAPILNVRARPNLNAPTMSWGPLKKGEVVAIILDGSEWSMVRSGKGQEGWVSDEYLTK